LIWEIQVETLRDLRMNNGYDLKLFIVSALIPDPLTRESGEGDLETAKNLIQNNTDWIDYYYHLPNQKVIELMKKAHIGLLPTYADTYGFAILEFQASGCPVISTNVRALAETNSNEIGWQIEVTKNNLGEAVYATKEDRLQLRDEIKEGLEEVVSEIFSNKDIILYKANAAIQKIRTQHSPEEYSTRLREIYNQVI